MPGMNGTRSRVSIVDFGSLRGGGAVRPLLVGAVCEEGLGLLPGGLVHRPRACSFLAAPWAESDAPLVLRASQRSGRKWA